MGQYNKKGMYSGYDKNNKEREALDYYATPPQEVSNILKTMGLEITDQDYVLDPACGGGHMMKGIIDYFPKVQLVGTDIKDRTTQLIKDLKENTNSTYYYGKEYDFLSDEYPVKECDYIIMNPPFSIIIPFVQHSLNIANKGVLMFGRLQFLESVARYEKIFIDNPPTDVWVYVDRVACYKNGDFSTKPSSVQAYAWFYWDKEKIGQNTNLKFIRSYEKSGK